MVWCSVVRIQGYDGRAALDENYLHIKLSAHDTPPPPPPSLMLRHGKMKIIVWVQYMLVLESCDVI